MSRLYVEPQKGQISQLEVFGSVPKLAIFDHLMYQICISYWHSLLCFEFHFLQDLTSDRKCYIKILLLKLRTYFLIKINFLSYLLFFLILAYCHFEKFLRFHKISTSAMPIVASISWTDSSNIFSYQQRDRCGQAH